MPIATADQIRNRPIVVTVPGTDLQIECCRPNLLDLIASNLLPLALYAGVLEQLAKWAEQGVEPSTADIAGAVLTDPKAYGSFIDRWVTAAAVKPRVTLAVEDVERDPSLLWIDDLDLVVKFDIVGRTYNGKRWARGVSAAVTEFRRVQPTGVDGGSNGQAVREETLGSAGGHGSGAGA